MGAGATSQACGVFHGDATDGAGVEMLMHLGQQRNAAIPGQGDGMADLGKLPCLETDIDNGTAGSDDAPGQAFGMVLIG